jgi:hypothetical protein
MKNLLTGNLNTSSDPRDSPSPSPSPPAEEPDEPLQVVFATEIGEASPDALPHPEKSPANKDGAS